MDQPSETKSAGGEAFRRRMSGNQEARHMFPLANNQKLIYSHNPQDTDRQKQELQESLLRLSQLQEENRRLKEQLKLMCESAERASEQKQSLANNLQSKIDHISEFQFDLQREHELRDSEWVAKAERYDAQLQDRRRQLQILTAEYKEQVAKKESVIYDLNQQLEIQKSRAEELLNNDFSLSRKLNELEQQNQQLERELVDSQVSLLELKKSVNHIHIKCMQDNQHNIVDITNNRLPTLETQTDTTYAIQNMEEKIKHLKEVNRLEKERYKSSMEYLVEYYEQQLNLIKVELMEDSQSKPQFRLLKTISAGQQAESRGEPALQAPLRQQLTELSTNTNLNGGRSRRPSQNFDNQSEFTEKYFCHQPTFKKQTIQTPVQCERCQSRGTSKRSSYAEESPEPSQRTSPSRITPTLILGLAASGALALYLVKRLMQTR